MGRIKRRGSFHNVQKSHQRHSSQIHLFVDSVLIDNDGIWIYLKEQYDFDDCGCCGGTCHVDTLKQVKEQFSYGVIPRKQ